MRDVAIVSFAQAPLEQAPGQTETLMLLPTITEALSAVGMTRRDVGFTCSGSADYLTGGYGVHGTSRGQYGSYDGDYGYPAIGVVPAATGPDGNNMAAQRPKLATTFR